MENITYLALGDSYTIGEQLALTDSFPYQFVQLLREQDRENVYAAAEIVAKTGWTTGELLSAVESYHFLSRYHMATLLIGVNNQYRNLDIETFKPAFEKLLRFAISAVGNAAKVFVLSIPDWGQTEFAAGRDREKISAEIDRYNEICRESALQHGCKFVEITSSYREDVADVSFVAADKLHPSGKEYAKWAKKLLEVFRSA